MGIFLTFVKLYELDIFLLNRSYFECGLVNHKEPNSEVITQSFMDSIFEMLISPVILLR